MTMGPSGSPWWRLAVLEGETEFLRSDMTHSHAVSPAAVSHFLTPSDCGGLPPSARTVGLREGIWPSDSGFCIVHFQAQTILPP